MTDLSHLDSIADDAESITEVVLAAMSRTDDARLKQILDALVRHAHAFFREVQLTDREFEQGIEFVKAIGQATVDDHNEVVLCADVLGFSTLVTLLNTVDKTDRTPGALLGPFYRGNSLNMATANLSSPRVLRALRCSCVVTWLIPHAKPSRMPGLTCGRHRRWVSMKTRTRTSPT